MLTFDLNARGPSTAGHSAQRARGAGWGPWNRWARKTIGVLALVLLASPLAASAGRLVIGLDLDQSGNPDCSATFADTTDSTVITGLDRWIEVTIDPIAPARVSSLTVLGCNGVEFTEALYATMSEWPVAVGAGLDASDVVEFEIPASVLAGAQSAQIMIGSEEDGFYADAFLTEGPIFIGVPVSVPLLSLTASLVLVMSLGWVALGFLRRPPRSVIGLVLLGVIAFADHRAGAVMGFLIDGALSDWIGIPINAWDPAGDSADPVGRGDLRSLSAAFENGSLFIRVDAAELEQSPCQTVPAVSGAADLSACVGTPSGGSCLLECAPGWEPSQASLSCQDGSWDLAGTCDPIVLNVTENTVVDEYTAVGQLSLASGVTLTLADGVTLSTGELAMASGSVLGDASANVSIEVGNTASLSGDASIVANNLNLSGGIWSLQDTASISANVDANVSSLVVCADCVITAFAQGHAAMAGPGGAGAEGSYRSGSGAGHGGEGGTGYNSANGAGSPYGNALTPNMPGSGGGDGCAGASSGGAGGGVLRLQVSGTFSLAGRLLAGGANGTNCMTDPRFGGGGGSGGSIWLTAGTLDTAPGHEIQAEGGHAGGNHSYYRGGGGGGGRILIEASAVTNEPDTALWSVDGGSGRSGPADRGTLWFSQGNDWTAYGTNSLDAATSWNALTLEAGSELTLATSNPLLVVNLVMEAGSRLLPAESVSISTETLVMNDGSEVEGGIFNLSVSNTATLSGDASILASHLTLSGGQWSLQDTASITGNVEADVTHLALCASCAITASAQGHPAATGPGSSATQGSNRSGSGAGHGGAGGMGANSSSAGGSPYGDALAPQTPGSGGGGGCSGSGAGGAGGGSLRLQVSDTLTLEGGLFANGANGSNCMSDSRFGGGGGSGGSVWLTAGTLDAGVGNQIQAQGGAAGGSQMTYRGGGGGGGRILIEATSVTTAPETTLWSVNGGSGRSGTADQGTLWFSLSNDWTAYGANSLDTPTQWDSLNLPQGSQLSLEAGSSLTLDDLVMNDATRLIATDGVLISADTFIMNTGAMIEGGHFALSVSDTANLSGDASVIADTLTLSGGDWSLQDTASIAGNVEANVQHLSVCADCSITASAKGYAATMGPGGASTEGISRSGSGAGHGGAGQMGFNSSGGAGSPYGEGLAPETMGSGGGGGCSGSGIGGTGGGTLRLQVSGTLSLSGRLLAQGTSGTNCMDSRYGGGGGSGGSIWLTAGTLDTAPGHEIQAEGGHAGGNHSYYRGGGGGGGRILIEASAVTNEPDTALWSVDGGSGRSGPADRGTLWFSQGNDWTAYGTNSLDAATSWNALTLEAGSELTLATSNPLLVVNLVMEAGSRLLPAESVSISTETLVMNDGSEVEGGIFNLSVSNTATLSGDASILASHLTLSGGQWSLQDTASITGNVEADVTHLALCASCAITASAQGHPAATGPGSSATQGSNRSGSGAGHGGAGGMGANSSSAGGSPYGDALAPQTPGSGGGGGCSGSGAGGAGGGSLRLQVSDTLTLEGGLFANGANGSNCMSDSRFGGGGGSGGSVWLTAGTLDAGVGNQIQAQGGAAGGSQMTYRGGGGGGGRILIEATSVTTAPETTLWSVNGGSGRSAGGSGSARLQAGATTTVLAP